MKVVDLGQPLIFDQINQIVAAVTNDDDLSLSTSGTTGEPKQIYKNLRTSIATKNGGEPSQIWLLAYSPNRWAGVSVILHCLKFDCTLVIPKSHDALGLLLALTETDYITHLSMTPSMFKSLIISDIHKRLRNSRLKQVTFGGETATQRTLDDAKTLWPRARITHTYASTEHGDICSASDGLEGFPKHKLDRHAFTTEGELVIKGHPTGDLWIQKDERYIYSGRTSEIINVGGNKVNPLMVEEIAVSCGAEMARCFSIASPILGSLVGLDYVGAMSPEDLQKHLKVKLPKFAWPRKVTQVDRIQLSEAGKMRRI